jgi:peptidoglycan hydrolase-like protein with peptidoglycan-binding domain
MAGHPPQVHDDVASTPTHDPQQIPRTRRRSTIAALAFAVVVAVGATGYVAISSQPADEIPSSENVSTAVVTKGNMVAETRLAGIVTYSDREPITAGLTGTVTELSPVAAGIASGGVLYRIDTRPVILLTGAMPAWRDFASGMADGEDVRQLEQNLAALGFFAKTPDARFASDTSEAIRKWQKSLGLERTGTVGKATVVFLREGIRVDSVESRLGAQVGPGSVIYQSTTQQQIVELDLPSAKRDLAIVGASVTIAATTGMTTAGVVEAVGAPASRPDADGTGTSVVIPVRISIPDQAAVAGLALASVTVSFAGTMKEDVLTIPVEALVPIDDSRFAVELPGKTSDGERKLIPVTVGAFASGMVEISGRGIIDGLAVVVPAA